MTPVDDLAAETPAYPGYATPTFSFHSTMLYSVGAHPWEELVGQVHDKGPAGWQAWDPRGAYVGLFPDKQAAGEALVKHAGFEVLR